MKKNGIFFIFYLFFIFSFNFSSEELKGFSACAELSLFIETNGFKVQKYPLMQENQNDFPFNIKILFDKNNISNNKNNSGNDEPFCFESPAKLIIAFTVEDAIENKEFISSFLKKISTLNRDYILEIIFTYGDNSYLENQKILKGTQPYISDLEGTDNINVICVKLVKDKSKIIPGGGFQISPASLLEITANAFSKANISYSIAGRFIISLYKLNILKDDFRTSLFLSSEIPAIGIELCSECSSSNVLFFEEVISNFNLCRINEWDKHSIFIRTSKKNYIINEKFTILVFIVFAFITLLALYEFSFIGNLKMKEDVQKIWYFIPLTIIFTALFFQFGEFVSSRLFDIFPILKYWPYTKITVKAACGFLLISFAYIFLIHFYGALSSKSYAYLLNISALFNVFLFVAVDISFFYLFFLEYLIIYISKFFKHTPPLFFIFIAILIPIIPYSVQILKYIKPNMLSGNISNSVFTNIFLAFILLPFEVVWLKILARFNKVWRKKYSYLIKFNKLNFIAASGAAVFFIILVISVNYFIFNEYKYSNEKSMNIEIEEDKNSIIDFYYKDYNYFGEINRVIFISLKEQAEICTVFFTGENGNPILHSDEFYIRGKNEDTLIMPVFPPQKLSFRYIANNEINSSITINAFVPELPEENKNNFYRKYRSYKKTIEIPLE